MPCVAPDGSLTPVAARVLGALAAAGPAGTADTVAGATGLPVYRARATLRELRLAGLVDEAGGGHVLTADGRAKLAAALPAASTPAPAPG